jgi:hypothetical protein
MSGQFSSNSVKIEEKPLEMLEAVDVVPTEIKTILKPKIEIDALKTLMEGARKKNRDGGQKTKKIIK